MARRYTRDNRGRFASVGATARGGRLATASGKKRETQMAKIKGGAASGTIGKPKGLKPGAIKAKPAAKSAAAKPAAKAAPSAATIAQVGRQRRATRNLNAAMKREADGPGSKASRSASVAKRASAIYAGRVDAKQKTAARLTKTTDAEALRKRVKKIKDNNAAKSGGSRKAVGSISYAKAGRIIGRIDANRPGLRLASGSARKTANAIKTQRKAVEFALAAGARARKQGKSLSLNDSLRRAVANAAKKRRRSG